MKAEARCPIIAMLTVLVALLSGSPASADDYSVDFGVEAEAGKDAGTLACQFGQTCDAATETLGLRVTFLVFRDSPERVTFHLYGRDLSCCYFEYAADKITVDPRKPLFRVPFFKGPGQGAACMLRMRARARSTLDSILAEIALTTIDDWSDRHGGHRTQTSACAVGQITCILTPSQALNVEPAPGNRPRALHLDFPNRTVAAGRTILLTKRCSQGASTRAAV